ncbi:MAG TPA: pteridine reductase [Steroidobacteraceae bacterium]|nr:pteridine reductase [Steroidobacteraceae bacterium]
MSPTLPLAGHVALVTGAGRRLGAAIARALHAEGARLVIHHRSSQGEAEALARELNDVRADSAITHAADLMDLGALPGLVAAALAAFGRLDVLVNNASTFYATPLGEITPQAFDDLIGTNLRAPLFLAQAAAPELRLRRGLVLNMVDIHAFRPLKRHPVYCAAKAGLAMLTQSLARELGPHVRVNGIAPGPVLWPDGEMDGDLKTRILDRTALKRMGTPEEVAKVALFFVRDAPYVTGQVLPVDGGRTVGGF